MDFYKKMIDGHSTKDETTGDAELDALLKGSDDVLHQSRRLFLRIQKIMVEEAKAISEDKSRGHTRAMFASMLLFGTAWQIIGWLWSGVRTNYKKDGQDGIVYRLWKVMEATFGAADNAEMEANTKALNKKWGIGDE